jgi:hypothetical protein
LNRLSDVVRGGSEEHCIAIEAQSRMLPGYPVGDLACDIVDSPQVSGKPWRRIEVL